MKVTGRFGTCTTDVSPQGSSLKNVEATRFEPSDSVRKISLEVVARDSTSRPARPGRTPIRLRLSRERTGFVPFYFGFVDSRWLACCSACWTSSCNNAARLLATARSAAIRSTTARSGRSCLLLPMKCWTNEFLILSARRSCRDCERLALEPGQVPGPSDFSGHQAAGHLPVSWSSAASRLKYCSMTSR